MYIYIICCFTEDFKRNYASPVAKMICILRSSSLKHGHEGWSGFITTTHKNKLFFDTDQLKKIQKEYRVLLTFPRLFMKAHILMQSHARELKSRFLSGLSLASWN